MLDSIIVGYGLAVFHFAWQLKQQNKKYLIISNNSPGSSRTAAGICNPTVLKRYTMAWQGADFLNYAIPHYQRCEDELQAPIFDLLPIHRYFYKSVEQNDWLVAAQREGLSSYLIPKPVLTSAPYLKRNAGYGIVKSVGRLRINSLLNHFQNQSDPATFKTEEFDYKALEVFKDKISYQGIEAKNIIFCEGSLLNKNPWFNYLPLLGSKGESLEIKAPGLPRNEIMKASLFISPIKEELFWVGASFSPKDKDHSPTVKGKEWLLKRLGEFITIPFEIVSHNAAIRPTVLDRRPLLGAHPEHSNVYVFNGLGTRGVLMAPMLSKWLYESIHEGKQIPQEVAIDRFESYFCRPNKIHV